jgi:hypothetical protein
MFIQNFPLYLINHLTDMSDVTDLIDLQFCDESPTYPAKFDITGVYRVAITTLGIVRRPVFYLKFNSTLSYLTGDTLCLRYERNRLMLSIGL